MYEYTIPNPPQGITFGGYDFAHSGGYNNDGTLVVRADTQEHLDQIVADIEAGTVPPLPLPAPSQEEVLLAETTLQLIESEQRIQELEAALADTVLRVMQLESNNVV